MRSPRDARQVDGVLLLDKPQGVGSNAALQYVRRLYRARRAGHTGTLDPMASGLLAICFGEATKFSSELLGAAKSYRALISLGVRTSTGDALGSALSERQVGVALADVEAALARFRGDIFQIPPMYSAIKRQGRPLYSYARQGKTFALEPRPVTIHSLDLVSFHDSRLELMLSCSKGTYVRALADDLGEVLGCGAHLCGLVRTKIGTFALEQSHAPSDLAALTEPERDRLLLAVDLLLGAYPQVELGIGDESRFRQGQPISAGALLPGIVKVYGGEQRFLGIGLADATGTLRPKRLLAGLAASKNEAAAAG